jgi:hypothetical protein
MNPKYLRIASDTHMEAFNGMNMDKLIQNFLPPDDRDAESILMLAGDISSVADQLLNFIHDVEKRFLKVFYIPGNHEYYHKDYGTWNKEMSSEFMSDTENTQYALGVMSYVEISDDLRVIFGTYWADGGTPLEQLKVAQYLNDFRLIMNGYDEHYSMKKFTVSDMIKIYKEQRKDLEKFLSTPFNGKTVVMTHHMPSYRLCHPRFGNECNGGFASNSDVILSSDNAPDIWIHGHTHDTIDKKLWDVNIVCNPAGYRGEWSSEYNKFLLGPKFVELNGTDI